MNTARFLLIILVAGPAWDAEAQFKLYQKGYDSYTAGNYSSAIINFSEYLTKGTRDKALDVEVFYLRALSYYKTNQHKDAIDDFQETLLLDHSNEGNIYWFMAKSYEKLSNPGESANSYTNALRLLGDNKENKAKLLWERSQIYTRMNNLPLAYVDLRALTVLQPSHAEAKQQLEKLEKEGVKAPVLLASAEKSTPDSKDQSAADKTTTQKNLSAANDGKNVKPASDGATQGSLAKNKVDPADNSRKGTKEESVQAATVPVVTNPSSSTLSAIAELYKDEKRYALVIGNSNYPKSIGVLRNPVNDATDFARELEASGFDVQLLTNATYGQMRAAMLRFKERVDNGDKDKTVSLFYYAGHGLQREEENYLVPIDATVEYEDDIQRYCFPVQRMVLANMERSKSRMNIVILDACRNNPFPSLNRSLGDDGLGEMRRARGSFIAYATAPGSVASDGTGRNGLYTQELVKAVKQPGLTIEQVFKEVRKNVLRLSGNKQNTWDSSNIVGEFYFKFPQ